MNDDHLYRNKAATRNIQVIEVGLLPPKPEDKIYTAKCSYCSTVMKFSRKDARLHINDAQGDWVEVTCPLCDKPVTADA